MDMMAGTRGQAARRSSSQKQIAMPFTTDIRHSIGNRSL
jgi:hypothetical protein